jgi:hypothetical protein
MPFAGPATSVGELNGQQVKLVRSTVIVLPDCTRIFSRRNASRRRSGKAPSCFFSASIAAWKMHYSGMRFTASARSVGEWRRSNLMNAYLIVSGLIFAAFGLVGLTGAIVESQRKPIDALLTFQNTAVGTMAVVLSFWAWRLFRPSANRESWMSRRSGSRRLRRPTGRF